MEIHEKPSTNQRQIDARKSSVNKVLQKVFLNAPEDVAAVIAHALSADWPLQRYVVAKPPFRAFLAIASFLPPHLRDLLFTTL